MASAGSSVEHSDLYGIDEAFSKGSYRRFILRLWNTQGRDGPVPSVREWSSGGMLAMNAMFFIAAIFSQISSTRASWYFLIRNRPV